MVGGSGNPLPQRQLREILAGWLRQALAERGWNQVQLAEATDVGREAINKIAQGRVTADDQTVAKLAAALGVDPPQLAASPFHLGVGDSAWFEAMAERYRRAAAALSSAEKLQATPLTGSGHPPKRRGKAG